jgi:SAM-dependent methyltransferase
MPGWPDAGRRIVQTPDLKRLLKRAVAGTPRLRTVVNAGAGEGLYTPVIRAFVKGALVLEFDAGMPPAAPPSSLQRFVASLTAIPIRPASVDLVVCTEVLEHVADDRTAVAEMRRVLAPTGHLILSVPTPPAVFDAAHVREGYTLGQLRSILEEHGLTIIEAQYCMHFLFQAVLRYWRPCRMPLGIILFLALLDQVVPLGSPMDLIVLARPVYSRACFKPVLRKRILDIHCGESS